MQNNPAQDTLTNKFSEPKSDANNMISAVEPEEIRKLSNHDLDLSLGSEIKRESQQTMVVVHHMREVDRRRLWAERGYASLSKYCADRFQMSDSDFYRKLSIMRTLNDVPEIEAKIISGDLNPTVVAMAHTYFRKKTKLKGRKVTKEEKTLVFEQIIGQSQREVERTFATLSPELPPTDQKKFISNDRIQQTYATNILVDAKFERLKEILLASLPNDPDRNDVLDRIFDIALEQVDPLIQIERAEKRKAAKLNHSRRMESAKNQNSMISIEAIKTNGVEEADSASKFVGACLVDAVAKNPKGKADANLSENSTDETAKSPALRKRCVNYRPYRRVQTVRFLYRRSGGICEFVCDETGRRCTARAALQGDHIQGYALGGSEDVENYRLYCHAHNQFAAMQTYGPEYMSQFVPSLR